MTGPEPAKARRGPRYVEGHTPRDPRFTPRQQLVIAVVGAVAAASLALFAGSRTWLVRTTARPAPAGPLVERISGASLVPLMPALALVALAGAGAVVATRGRWRSVVGVVITFSGLGIVILQKSPAGTDGIGSGWVLVAALCGVAIATVGAFTLRNGGRWPTMGARYDRPGPAATVAGSATPGPEVSTPDGGDIADERAAGSDRAVDAPATNSHIGDSGWWDAIDRGEDPTKE